MRIAARLSLAGDIIDRRVAVPLAIVALQFIAALYFVVDGVSDLIEQADKGFDHELAMECLICGITDMTNSLGPSHLWRWA